LPEGTATSGSGFVTKDSGARIEFGTGSVRDTEAGKLDWTLLPRRGLARLVGLLMRGAEKYGRHNWQLGQSLGRAERSLERHWAAYLAGEREEDHLAAVVFNACVILDHEDRIAAGELPARLDDRDECRRTAAAPSSGEPKVGDRVRIKAAAPWTETAFLVGLTGTIVNFTHSFSLGEQVAYVAVDCSDLTYAEGAFYWRLTDLEVL
jgi:hypothetical protein